jgi:hypothetical protein
MKTLTKSQIQFLEQHGIGMNQTFNAQGLTKSEYHDKMKVSEKIIAFNVTPCQKEGHTLRTRSGHCAQCNTAHLGFQKRNDNAGFVYIAGTKKGKLIKVGFTSGVEIRSESLNRTKYGEFSDWEILFAVSCTNAGQIENKIKSKLIGYSFSTNYQHDRKNQLTDELYRCSYSKAKENLKNILENGDFNSNIKIEKIGNNYEFQNLISR